MLRHVWKRKYKKSKKKIIDSREIEQALIHLADKYTRKEPVVQRQILEALYK